MCGVVARKNFAIPHAQQAIGIGADEDIATTGFQKTEDGIAGKPVFCGIAGHDAIVAP